MDYSVGSVADFITGSKTPNKPKVVTKKVSKKSPKIIVSEEVSDEVLTPSKSSQVKDEQPSPKRKRSLGKSPKSPTSLQSFPKPKKFKKEKKALKVFEQEELEEALPKPKKFKKEKKALKVEQEELEEVESEEPKPIKRSKKQKKVKINLEVEIDNEIDESTDFNDDVDNDDSGDEDEKDVKLSENAKNAQKRINKTGTKPERTEFVEDPERSARTLCVRNLPVSTTKHKIFMFFKKYGNVESVRIRGVPVANPNIPKKIAVRQKNFNPNRKSFYAFVVFETREDALKGTAANNVVFEGHHLTVSVCDDNKKDESKAIFIGNMGFSVEDEDLHNVFGICGPITSVRIVRDNASGMGKGFGYVNFENRDSVQLALEMKDVKIGNRELRIMPCNIAGSKKGERGGPKKQRWHKVNPKQGHDVRGSRSDGPPAFKKSFEGAKFAAKNNKKKFDKGAIQKKRMVKKLAPKVAASSF